jgi:regulator of protease activity HflC (stomatin/prohibitin superfamily)
MFNRKPARSQSKPIPNQPRKEIRMNSEILLISCIVIFVIVTSIFASSENIELRRVFHVPEGWAGLVYRHGLYVRRHNAGRHIVWGLGWTINLVDLRRTTFELGAQDVLTCEKVGLKVSLLVSYEITDPARASHQTQNWLGDLHHAAQLALRAVVSGVAVESLFKQRHEIGAQLLGRIQPEAAKLGVNVLAVEVKDVLFPAELEQAFADALKTRLESRRTLEQVRG